MLKNIQIKIVFAFTIIGLILISFFGITNIYNLQNIGNSVNNLSEITEIKNVIENEIYQVKIMTCACMAICVILMVIMGIIVSKLFISPISSLIKSAEKATKNERIKYLNEGKKKNEINDLVSAFDNMNNELKENLNEATRQTK